MLNNRSHHILVRAGWSLRPIRDLRTRALDLLHFEPQIPARSTCPTNCPSSVLPPSHRWGLTSTCWMGRSPSTLLSINLITDPRWKSPCHPRHVILALKCVKLDRRCVDTGGSPEGSLGCPGMRGWKISFVKISGPARTSNLSKPHKLISAVLNDSLFLAIWSIVNSFSWAPNRFIHACIATSRSPHAPSPSLASQYIERLLKRGARSPLEKST